MDTNYASRIDLLERNPKKSGPLYLPQERRELVWLVVASVAVAVIVLGAVLIGQHRAAVANRMMSEAMRTYGTAIVQPGQPVSAGEPSFPTAEARARAANAQFAAVADHYGMTDSGRNAKYLQGVTAVQMGQLATGEALLKSSAESWNRDISALAKLALADLYHATNRDAQAIDEYNQLIQKPTTAVPKGLAQLELAGLYASEGKKEQSRKIYAEIKDKDPKSAAAELASQYLGETPTRPAQ